MTFGKLTPHGSTPRWSSCGAAEPRRHCVPRNSHNILAPQPFPMEICAQNDWSGTVGPKPRQGFHLGQGRTLEQGLRLGLGLTMGLRPGEAGVETGARGSARTGSWAGNSAWRVWGCGCGLDWIRTRAGARTGIGAKVRKGSVCGWACNRGMRDGRDRRLTLFDFCISTF